MKSLLQLEKEMERLAAVSLRLKKERGEWRLKVKQLEEALAREQEKKIEKNTWQKKENMIKLKIEKMLQTITSFEEVMVSPNGRNSTGSPG